MPFGDTAKKIQRVADIAEKLYERLNQVIEQVQDVRERVESTSDQIEAIDRELAEQRAIVEALAEEQGVDIEGLIAEQFPEAEVTDDGAGGAASGDSADAVGDGGDDGSSDAESPDAAADSADGQA